MAPAEHKGIFTISLDFELLWGVRDHRDIQSYGDSIARVHEVVPALLQFFEQYGVHCTWATVGLLFATSKEDALRHLPAQLPAYEDGNLSPYPYLVASPALDEQYHFAPGLIRRIAATPGQEIGTHTFSHYYTLEAGAAPDSFAADLQAANAIAAASDQALRTIVFPRNQYSDSYLQVCHKAGIAGYRGTENHWLYATRSRSSEQALRRIGRLCDSYLNLSGHHTHPVPAAPAPGGLINIPASRFLRPFSPRLQPLDALRLRRICGGMTHASRKGEIYHLWWHPHNFGRHTAENLAFLEKILQHYHRLQQDGKMESLNMLEICQRVNHVHG